MIDVPRRSFVPIVFFWGGSGGPAADETDQDASSDEAGSDAGIAPPASLPEPEHKLGPGARRLRNLLRLAVAGRAAEQEAAPGGESPRAGRQQQQPQLQPRAAAPLALLPEGSPAQRHRQSRFDSSHLSQEDLPAVSEGDLVVDVNWSLQRSGIQDPETSAHSGPLDSLQPWSGDGGAGTSLLSRLIEEGWYREKSRKATRIAHPGLGATRTNLTAGGGGAVSPVDPRLSPGPSRKAMVTRTHTLRPVGTTSTDYLNLQLGYSKVRLGNNMAATAVW